MSQSTDLVLARIRDGGLVRLARLAVEHVLTQPVSALLDPAWTADLALAALDAAAHNPAAEAQLLARAKEARARVPNIRLQGRLPAEAMDPLREALARPYVPDRVLVRRLLRHEAAERLLKDILMGALQGFAKRLRSPAPNLGRSLGRFKDAFGDGMREGLLGGLSHELERQAEARVREFVDSALQTLMDEVALHLSDPAHAATYGAWRAFFLDTLLDTPLPDLAREVDKLDLEALVRTTVGVARSLSRRPESRDELRSAFEVALREAGGRTVRELLAEGGLPEDVWRGQIEEMLVRQAEGFVETAAFRGWLEEVLGE